MITDTNIDGETNRKFKYSLNELKIYIKTEQMCSFGGCVQVCLPTKNPVPIASALDLVAAIKELNRSSLFYGTSLFPKVDLKLCHYRLILSLLNVQTTSF